MSVLIADAGGTKTDWRYISNGLIQQFQSRGYNATTHNLNQLKLSFVDEVKSLNPSKIYYYAAGVISAQQISVLESHIRNVFTQKRVEIEVASDLLGAARGLYNKESGAVGILGTGSAGFFYDGSVISRKVPSLGFKLGNEGSGYDLGKNFVKRFLRGRFNTETRKNLIDELPWFNEEVLLEKIYSNNEPFDLAILGEVIYKSIRDPEVWQMVFDSLREYCDVFFKEMKPDRIRFTGSVAYIFQDILRDVCRACQLNTDRIIQSPIAGLTLYHQTHE